jgi:hypothetical protein
MTLALLQSRHPLGEDALKGNEELQDVALLYEAVVAAL